jgi:hypothetical protein
MNAQTESVEAEIQRKGPTSPRVTPADIEANIAAEHYFTAAEGVIGANGCERGLVSGRLNALTICVLTLRNGFVVLGHSVPIQDENFNAELGRRIAREDAIDQMWPLLGYAQRETLHQASRPDPDAR